MSNHSQRLDPNKECAKGNHIASSEIEPGVWLCVWCQTKWRVEPKEAPRADAV